MLKKRKAKNRTFISLKCKKKVTAMKLDIHFLFPKKSPIKGAKINFLGKMYNRFWTPCKVM